MYCTYNMSLLLYKTFNDKITRDEWIHLNIDQHMTSRQTNFMINRNNNLVVGMNALSNRFYALLNGLIPLTWFNDGYQKF